MIHEPLYDLAGRTLSVGSDATNVVEALLRLQNANDYQRPITIYVVGSPSVQPLPPTDAVMLCSLIRSLRSPIVTIGMGILQNTLPLILATGTHRRYLLRHTLISLAPIKWDSLPATRTPIGLGHQALSRSPRAVLEEQMEQLLSELKLDPGIFQSERLLTVDEAIQLRLADTVVTHAITPPTLISEPTHETHR